MNPRNNHVSPKQVEIIDNFWNKILTPGGATFMKKYGKLEMASIYFLQGRFWNPQLNFKLHTGDIFTIAEDKDANLSGFSFKVMNSTILRLCPKCDKEMLNDPDNNNYIISKKYASGMLFKYKGTFHLLFIFMQLVYIQIYLIKTGKLSWISRSRGKHLGKVVKLYKLFNNEGIQQIQNRIDSFERLCAFPFKYSWTDKKEFYTLPLNNICWGPI